MTRMRCLSLALAGAFAAHIFAGSGAAYAKKDERTDEAATMANAKVTMAQAIAAAEQRTGGKAVSTGIEDQDGAVFLEVTVVANSRRQKVLVDPQTGNVVKTVQSDDDEHENDD